MSLRERKKQQVRENIMAAAAGLIESNGYEKTTMRDVAAASDLSYQTLYNYFPTKAQVLRALLTQDIAEVQIAAQRLIDAYQGHLLDTLYALNRRRLDAISHRDRALWRIVTLDLWEREGNGHVYQLIDADARRSLQALLARAQDDGDLDAYVDVDLLADVLFALSQDAFSNYIMDAQHSKTELLKTLQDRNRLLIIPYLRTYS